MRYVRIEEAKPGMVLAKGVYDSYSCMLIAKSRLLSAEYITKLKERGYLGFYIEDAFSKGIEIEETISVELRNRGAEALRKKDVDAGVQVAKDVVKQLLGTKTVTLDMVDLRTFDDYTYRHSVNVAVLSTIIGMGLGLKQDELNDLCAAAIFHDLGKLMIDPEVLNKPGRLTKEEFQIIKSHPQLSADLLVGRLSISPDVRMGVLSHHENEDGSGYPNRLEGDNIPLYGKIIHVADVYDALVSKRPYKDPYTPSEAIEYLMGGCNILFDMKIVTTFMKWVPVYPKGVVVQLSDGREAIVYENTNNPLRPKVRLRDGSILDLGDENKYLNITINPSSSTQADYSNELEAAHTKTADHRPVLLVVDDSLMILQMIRDICEAEFRVVMAKTGKEAITYIHKNGMPAIILMDVVLPVMDGIEVVKNIKLLYEDVAPVIFLTGLTDRKTVEACREVGAADYVIKPFRASYLMGRIKVALGLDSEV